MLRFQKLKPAKVLGVALVAGAIAASAAALVAGRAQTTPALPLVLSDESGAFSLAVQVELGRRDTGKFSFDVYGTGVFTGTIPERDSGPHNLHLQATTTGRSRPVAGGPGTPAEIRMEGVINVQDHSANVNIWTPSAKFHLKTESPPVPAAGRAAQQALDAIVARDGRPFMPSRRSR